LKVRGLEFEEVTFQPGRELPYNRVIIG